MIHRPQVVEYSSYRTRTTDPIQNVSRYKIILECTTTVYTVPVHVNEQRNNVRYVPVHG